MHLSTSWAPNLLLVAGLKMGLITLTGLVLKAALLAMAQGLHLTTPMEQVKVRNERKTTEFDNMFHSVVLVT